MTFVLQLLHAADQEAGAPAVDDIPNFSAVLNKLLEDPNPFGDDPEIDATLILSSGDALIPGVFYSASEPVFGAGGRADILVQNELGFHAISFGNHEFDLGTTALAGWLGADGDYIGAQFPYLSGNLDFTTAANLAGFVAPDGQTLTVDQDGSVLASEYPANSLAGSMVIEVQNQVTGEVERIGIVSATTPTITFISSPGDVTVSPQPFDATPSPEQLDALAALIQEDVDALLTANPEMNKVILLAHMQQIAIEQALAERLTDVDIIIAGGSNTLLADETDVLRPGDAAQGPYPILTSDAEGNPVAIVNTDGNYRYVGQLIVEFDDQGIIVPDSLGGDAPQYNGAYSTSAENVEALDATGLINPEIAAITDAIREQIVATESNVQGVSGVYINGLRNDVRTQETNGGNLTADAALWTSRQADDSVSVFIKNGGGIRDDIGIVTYPPGSTEEELRLPTEGILNADGSVVKPVGGISETDIANMLSFNNGLTLLTLSAEDLVVVLEHGFAGSAPGATPGRFPQLAGVQVSVDFDAPPNMRIVDFAIVDEAGGIVDLVVVDGGLVGNPDREIRIGTLNFLADGGDGYPFDTLGEDRVDLVQDNEAPRTGEATFAADGTEQDSLAEFLQAFFRWDGETFDPAAEGQVVYAEADVPPSQDLRIQPIDGGEDNGLRGSIADLVILGTSGDDVLNGGAGSQQILGLGGDDVISGGSGDDDLDGGAGNDDIDGGSGNDMIWGGDGNDTIDGGSGNDTIAGGAGDDVISGGSGNDLLFGNDGDDILFGGSGNDTLRGGLGDDTMTGGTGADIFVLAVGEGTDTITDFSVGRDLIGLADGLSFGVLTFSDGEIAADGEILAILVGVDTTSLTAGDFLMM